MKKVGLLLIAAALAGSAVALTDEERIILRNLGKRERCVSRSPVVINAVTNIVETWRRGDFVWVQTNAVRTIVGKRQTNTFEEKLAAFKAQLEEYRADAEVTNKMRGQAKRAGKNLAKVIKAMEQAIKKAATEEEAELYRMLIELLEGSAE
jgi:hypothetical protein